MVTEFLHFLLHNRINLCHLFRANLKSKTVKVIELRELLKKYHYKGSNPGDVDLVIKFFKWTKDASLVNLVKIIVYVRRIDPMYGKDNSELADAEASK